MLDLLWGTSRSPSQSFGLFVQKPGTEGIYSRWYSLDTPENVINEDLKEVEKYHVWFSVCSRRTGLSEKTRGKEADITGMPCVWADFDYASPTGAHAKKGLPSKAQVEDSIMALAFGPSIIINSGYGYHCYWKFTDPWFFNPGNFHDVKTYSENFQTWLRGQIAFKIDSTADLPRMLRYPNTVNWKDPKIPRPVIILADKGPQYARGEIAKLWGTHMVTTGLPPERPTKGGATSAQLRPFDAAEVTLRLSTGTQNPVLAKRIVNGKPLGEPGERNAMCNKAANLLAFMSRKALGMSTTVDDLFDMLTPSYTAMAMDVSAGEDNPPPTEGQIRRMLDRALDKAAEAAAEEAAAEVPAPVYTEEDVQQFAESIGITPESFNKRWIIAYNGNYFTFVKGEYRLKPWSKQDLLVSLRQDLSGVPDINWKVATANGGERDKNASEIVLHYGTTANDIKKSLVAQKSYYDDKIDTFVLASAPLAKLEPEYNIEIEKWLHLLGGDQKEILLDWIASVTDLSKPSAALYLSGHHGAGKTMLAHGLAKLWQTGTYTELNSISKYNANISRSPLIFGDEQIPKNVDITSTLRRYIANSSHQIEEKFMPVITLEGCVRVLLAANNDELLSEANQNNNLMDIEAIAQRFNHISVDDSASKYLASIGGRTHTESWVDGCRIARFALWLKASRTAKLGARFLNEGQRTEFHSNMLASGDKPSQVVEALGTAFSKPAKGIVTGQGFALVNSQALFEHWDEFSSAKRPYDAVHGLGKILKRLSKNQQVRVRTTSGQHRYFVVDWEFVLQHCEKNGFNVTFARKRITDGVLAGEFNNAIAVMEGASNKDTIH
jgi:hypothetical protein